MQAGQFDRRIWLMPPTRSQSDSGAEVISYPEEGWIAVWANRKDEAGGDSEGSEANRLTAKSVVSWAIRHRTGLDCTWRLKDADGLEYDIVRIQPSKERNMYLYLKTTIHD